MSRPVCAMPPLTRFSAGRVSRNTSRQAARMTAPTTARKRNTPRQSVTRAQLPADQGADDGGQAAEPGQPPVVAQQRSAGVEVPAGGLGDHDPPPAGEALDEPG